MFKVDQSENRLIRLDNPNFRDLNLQERAHLQEWLAHEPEALGEELLIIQKEFDGFAGTWERLDLLALDKEGRLVVIENKLDDSGRDVVSQALKYAAYCSSLKKSEIVDIYQDYLSKISMHAHAEANLRDFLDVEDLESTVLNAGNSQRIILVAANFRKGVTATALWLLEHGIQVQCFRALPYRLGEEILIDIRQIIPVPEAAEYMIGMAAKDSEERAAQDSRKRFDGLFQAFWTMILDEFRNRGVTRYSNASPPVSNWLTSNSGVPGCEYHLAITKTEVRVELYLQRSKSENKEIFDRLRQEQEDIEKRFGSELLWRRLDQTKNCRICRWKGFDSYDENNWHEMVSWLCDHLPKLEEAFSEPLARLGRELNAEAANTKAEQGNPG